MYKEKLTPRFFRLFPLEVIKSNCHGNNHLIYSVSGWIISCVSVGMSYNALKCNPCRYAMNMVHVGCHVEILSPNLCRYSRLVRVPPFPLIDTVFDLSGLYLPIGTELVPIGSPGRSTSAKWKFIYDYTEKCVSLCQLWVFIFYLCPDPHLLARVESVSCPWEPDLERCVMLNFPCGGATEKIYSHWGSQQENTLWSAYW